VEHAMVPGDEKRRGTKLTTAIVPETSFREKEMLGVNFFVEFV